MALPGMLTHKPQSCLVSTFLFFCSFFLHRYSLSSPHFRFPQLSLKPLNIRKLVYPTPFFFFLFSSKTSISPLFLTGTPLFLTSSPSLYPPCLAHHPLKLHHSSHLSLATSLFPVQQKKVSLNHHHGKVVTSLPHVSAACSPWKSSPTPK